jgi:SnoaL-like domain
MTERAMSRRTILETGACALVGAASVPQMAGARAATGLRSKSEDVIRKYYAAWETKDWPRLDRMLADDFTFSSPLDDHITKSDYKTGCWDTQIAFIDRFDLKQVIGTDNEAFVMYVCHTANGKTLQNVEYFHLRDAKVKAVECYFGGKASFPSAVSAGKG